jgi:GNAT superfamily N-acetyltransferase
LTKITLQTCTGPEIAAAIPALARLRILVFREFPYLYDGDEDYERSYLQVYATCGRAAVIVARDGTAIVGASTCIPLPQETAAVRAPFESRGLDLDDYFYFGESVLRPEYRGQGIGVKFFEAREAVARHAGAAFAVFCAVRREDSHPARPVNIADMPRFWRNRGFAPLVGVSCQMEWKEPGTALRRHDLDFWIKPLGPAAIPGEFLATPA